MKFIIPLYKNNMYLKYYAKRKTFRFWMNKDGCPDTVIDIFKNINKYAKLETVTFSDPDYTYDIRNR